MTSGTPAQVGAVAWLDDQGRLVRLEGVGNGGTVMPGRAIPDSWQPLHTSHSHRGNPRSELLQEGEQPATGASAVETITEAGNDSAQAHRVEQLEAALAGMVKRYVGLVECGDCGNWDAEKEPEVIAARAALKEGA